MKRQTILFRYRRLWTAGLLVGVLLAAAPLYGQTYPESKTTQGAGAARLEHPGPAKFVKEAARDNEAEIAMAKVAQQKAQNPQVKALAEMIQKDHQQANQMLKPIAQAQDVKLKRQLSKEQENELQKLQTASGREFDKDYVTTMLRDHRSTIAKFERVAQQSELASVRQYAEKCLPTLREHLQHAEQVARAIGLNPAAVSSARQPAFTTAGAPAQ